MWVLWNDICRYPREIQSVRPSQLAARRDSVSYGERQRIAGRPAGAAFHRVAKKNYGSIWQSVFVSLCLPLSLTHHIYLNLFLWKKCESYVFITRCYGRSSSMPIHNSFLPYGYTTVWHAVKINQLNQILITITVTLQADFVNLFPGRLHIFGI